MMRSLALATVAAAAPPNIFFILVDDLGFGDVGFNRKEVSPEIVSPNMDALVESGVHLTRHYVHRMCTPTRTSVQSGRLPVHVNTGLGSPCNDDTGIPRNMTGFAEHLQHAGYSTHFAGKWDAGMATPKHTPHGRGYDTSLHYFSHKNDFWSQANMQTCCEPDQTIIDFWRTDRGAADVNNTDYSEFLFRNELVGIVEKHDIAKPLLLFYAPHVAHCPLQVPKEYYDKFAFMSNDEGKCSAQTVKSVHPIDPRHPELEYKCRQQYHAMVMVMDEVVGNVTEALKKKGMWENTLVVMSSDNGGPVDLNENAANNWPLRGGKYSLFEGGIRVAAFISGGLIPSPLRGTVNNGMIHIADWYSTFAGLAGMDPTDKLAAANGLPPIDSMDMWPFLSGKVKESPRDAIPIGKSCIVQGDWKLITAKTTPDFWQGPTFPNSTSLAEGAPARPFPYPTECKAEAAQEWTKNEDFQGAICSSSMESCFNVQQGKTNIILYASQDGPNERFTIAANGSLVGDLRGECVRVNGLGQQHTFGACDQDEWAWSFRGKELSVSHRNGTKWCIAAHEAPGPAPFSDHCAGGCLFNVVEDPTEQSNVYADHADLVASMSARLDTMKESFFENKDKFSNDCPDGTENCACWMAKNRYEGFMGPYALTSSRATLV